MSIWCLDDILVYIPIICLFFMCLAGTRLGGLLVYAFNLLCVVCLTDFSRSQKIDSSLLAFLSLPIDLLLRLSHSPFLLLDIRLAITCVCVCCLCAQIRSV